MLIEARDLHVRRGGRAVLRGVDLSLRPAEALVLIGPNAAGKSTLLRALAGVLPIARGDVLLEDRVIAGWKRAAVARRVALVTAEDAAPDRLTVADRVALGRYPHRGPLAPLNDSDHAAIARALALTEIEHLARRPLGTLSAGERQLACLARGLAQEPALLLLDEPAAHLDLRHQLHLFRVLDEVRGQGVAVIAVVHDLQRATWAPRLAVLDGGRITADGPPAEVLESEAARRAFGVLIRGIAVHGSSERLWRVEESEA